MKKILGFEAYTVGPLFGSKTQRVDGSFINTANTQRSWYDKDGIHIESKDFAPTLQNAYRLYSTYDLAAKEAKALTDGTGSIYLPIKLNPSTLNWLAVDEQGHEVKTALGEWENTQPPIL